MKVTWEKTWISLFQNTQYISKIDFNAANYIGKTFAQDIFHVLCFCRLSEFPIDQKLRQSANTHWRQIILISGLLCVCCIVVNLLENVLHSISWYMLMSLELLQLLKAFSPLFIFLFCLLTKMIWHPKIFCTKNKRE